MSTKGFFLLVITIATFGGSIGGSFAGGVAFGRSDDNGQLPTTDLAALRGGQFLQGLPEGQGLQRPGLPDGPGSSSEPQRGTQSGPGDAGVFGGRTVINGTVIEVDGDWITIATESGPVKAKASETTSVQRYEDGDFDSLSPGEPVLVIASPPEEEGEDLVAVSIVANPPVGTGFSGRGNFGARPRAP